MTLLSPRPTPPAPLPPQALIPEARARQRRRRIRTTLSVAALLVAASLVAVVAVSALTAASPRSARDPGAAALSTPRVMTCLGSPVIEPRSLTLSCADANAALVGVRWTHWGATGARGVATFILNSCTPTCVASRPTRYAPATVILDEPVTTGTGVRFSRARVTYPVSGSPVRFQQSLVTTARS